MLFSHLRRRIFGSQLALELSEIILAPLCSLLLWRNIDVKRLLLLDLSSEGACWSMLLEQLPGVLEIFQVVLEYRLSQLRLALLSN